MTHLFIFGLGYSAEFLARNLQKQGWIISGTKRQSLEHPIKDIKIYPFDSTTRPDWELPKADFILSSIPPSEKGDPVLRYFKNNLEKATPSWVGYLSTTGVYGDHQGKWVDETSPCHPSGNRQTYRLKAEQEWQALGAHIFRIAGIYGPERSVFDQIAEGKAKLIHKPGHQFGRIHVADIAGILESSMKSPKPGEIYNLTDDEPAEPIEVTRYAYQLLGKPAPDPIDFSKAELSPMAKSFWQDHKKVRNQKVKEQLHYRFLYPDFRAGLKAIKEGTKV